MSYQANLNPHQQLPVLSLETRERLNQSMRDRYWSQAKQAQNTTSNSGNTKNRWRNASGNAEKSEQPGQGTNTWCISKKASTSPTSLRGANSLDSLDSDAVSTFIEQARAQSTKMRQHKASVVDSTTSTTTKKSPSKTSPHIISHCAEIPQMMPDLLSDFHMSATHRQYIRQVSTGSETGSNTDASKAGNSHQSSLERRRISTFKEVPKVSPSPLHQKRPQHSSATSATTLEVSRLERLLQNEREQVQRLTEQLATNNHVVSAFEQSLSSLTEKMAKLNEEAQKKDVELLELRKAVDRMSSTESLDQDFTRTRWKSDENVLRLSQNNNDESSSVKRRNSKPSEEKQKRKSWLRSSISKAFSRRKSHHSTSDLNNDLSTSMDLKAQIGHQHEEFDEYQKNQQRSASVSALDVSLIPELEHQLMMKETLLTESRLDALNSESQLQALKESIAEMQRDLEAVKFENQELKQKLSWQQDDDVEANVQDEKEDDNDEEM